MKAWKTASVSAGMTIRLRQSFGWRYEERAATSSPKHQSADMFSQHRYADRRRLRSRYNRLPTESFGRGIVLDAETQGTSGPAARPFSPAATDSLSEPEQISSGCTAAVNHPVKKSTTPVPRLYIAPLILIAPLDSIVASTELSLRMLPIVSSTFFRATASTNA
jgi:hypothetical protein